jgi:uncharacterized alkaline shock family protein YloU
METQTRPAGLAPRSAGRPMPTDPAAPARPRGTIEVSARAIATVAGRATIECYGVVGVADRLAPFGWLRILPPERYSRGIEVRFIEDHVAIDLHVVLEYGLRIAEIARNLIKDVKYAVEHTLGLPVVEVNVDVEGVRLSDRDPRG